MKYLLVPLALVLSLPATSVEIVEELPVDRVWSGHPVGFALLTEASYQFAAYYNADRQLVVASRMLDESTWTRTPLPEHVAWDSHNYLTMALDAKQQLHLSGNMHCAPLAYFKTTNSFDASSLTRVSQMVGREESRMTYPRFFRGPSGEFIYTYRDGSSGSGNQIYNVYDEAGDTWVRLLDQPLTDGRGEMNAYISTPQLGPDGNFHVVWVWRDTPDCATNHHVSYMRSRDLRHWETIDGHPIVLPVTIDSLGVVVDPVPPGGGLINGNATLGFDVKNRPVVSYHKYDGDGNSQIYNARWDGSAWVRSVATTWDTRWDFSGGGSIDFKIRVQPVKAEGRGGLVQEWSHWQRGHERWKVDPVSLRATEKLPPLPSNLPAGFQKVRSVIAGMGVRTTGDLGGSPEPGTRYLLRWETLGKNRDRPHEPPLPDATPLVLYKLRE